MKKLSEFKGLDGIHTLARLVAPVSRIAKDGKLWAIFGKEPPIDGENIYQTFARRCENNLGFLLDEYAVEIMKIISVLDGVEDKDFEEYVANKLTITIPLDIIQMLNDDGLEQLFISAETAAQQEASAAVSENFKAET